MLDFSHAPYLPFLHQVEDTQAVIDNPYFFIASEMRTGKTKIVIDAAQFLFHANQIDRVIVVAPAPCRSVWVGAEASSLGGELREHLWKITNAMITEFHSDTSQWLHKAEGERQLRIIVTNYEFIRPMKRHKTNTINRDALNTLLKACHARTLLVLDESGAITESKSSTFKACLEMRRKCGRVVLMNGTPMDTPLQLFAQGNMLHDSVLDCKYKTHFLNRYAQMGGWRVGGTWKFNPKTGKREQVGGRATQVIGWTNQDDLQRRFARCTVRRLQKDCLDVPPKLPAVTLAARLTPAEWRYYVEMRDDMVVSLEGGNASVSSQVIVKFMRLSQITGGFLGGIEDAGLDPPCPDCNGAGCDACEMSGIGPVQPVASVREIGRSKLDVLLFLIGQQLEKDPHIKIVVWARFTDETMRILREVALKFPKMIVAGLHGGQSKQDRAFAKMLLHPTSSPVDKAVLVAGTLGTGSYGLDFSASHTSINYSYDHSLRKFLQSGDRVYGPRQTQPIDYFDIVAVGPKGQRTYDSVIVEARHNKQQIADWTVSAWVKALAQD